MFGFIMKIFILIIGLIGLSLNVIPLTCVSMSNQECKIRPVIININSKEYYPYSILVNKCSGSCNDINEPYAKLFIPDVVKNINIKAFNLMSRNNKKHVSWHETCTCKCRLDASISDNKQHWNNNKYICECKELIYKSRVGDGLIWNPSICECEYDKSCNMGEYLDYQNCESTKKLIDNLVEEDDEDINSFLFLLA